MISTKNAEIKIEQTVRIIICDQCNTEIESVDLTLPAGCFIVRKIKYDSIQSDTEDKDFCSEVCLSKYYWRKEEEYR